MESIIEKKRKTSTRRIKSANSTKLEPVFLPDNLMDFIAERNKKLLKDLKGKICFRDDFI